MSKKGGKDAAPAPAAPVVPKKKKELTEEELAASTPSAKRAARKDRLRARFEECFSTYKNMMVIGIDNVGSNQMQKIRISLRGRAVILNGKNTLIRKIIRDRLQANPEDKIAALLPLIKGNIGLVFTEEDLNVIRKSITENKVPAAARPNTFAPIDVIVPAGPTGLDPGQTSFFQALAIPTKIVKGAIEITDNWHLVKAGEKVTASAVALLSKLNIKPFFYGIVVLSVYEDGSTYDAKILDISQDDLRNTFFSGVRTLAALGLATGYTCEATIPHQLNNGFKFLLAISLATEFTFKEAQIFKDYLANPSAFASSAPAASSGSAAAAAPKEEVKEEEEEVDMGFSLFD